MNEIQSPPDLLSVEIKGETVFLWCKHETGKTFRDCGIWNVYGPHINCCLMDVGCSLFR